MDKVCITDKKKIAEIIEEVCTAQFDKNYYKKSTASILKLGDNYIKFKKPSIKKDFYFGEHGYDFEEKQETCRRLSKDEQYFLKDNLSGFDRELEAVDNLDQCSWNYYYLIVAKESYNGFGFYSFVSRHNLDRYGKEPYNNDRFFEPWTYKGVAYHFATDEERETIKAAIIENRAAFEKRLKTYLKRYGLSKCHYSTYWADR